MGLFNYLKLLALFQDVSGVYKEEQGKDKPAWLSRRFWGAFALLLGTFLSLQFGIADADFNVEAVADNLALLASLLYSGYGAVLFFVGLFGAIKKKIGGNNDEPPTGGATKGAA